MASVIRVRARSQSGSLHVVTGTVEGGVRNKSPGWGVPFRSKEQAREHLEHNGWTDLEFLEGGAEHDV